MKADSYRMRVKGQAGMYLSSNSDDEGICKRPICGWHAELNKDGFCGTRECREARIKTAEAQGRVIRHTDAQGNKYIVVRHF